MYGACQVGLVPDSGLDASSQYPSLGSFTTPAARLMVETRGVPQGFLSYYHVMPSSRPFTGEMLAWDWEVPYAPLRRWVPITLTLEESLRGGHGLQHH